MTETGKSFWHTAPGVITAVATLITALGGVLAILAQNDMLGGASRNGSPVVTDAPEGGDADPADSPVSPAKPLAASPLIPWASATASLVRQDETSATVKAATVGLACDRETVRFKNGQSVSLERVRSIQFDAIYSENGSADGIVTLLDGRELTDPIHTWNCPVMAANELGALEVQLRDIKRIDFHR